ncbi:MAG TPA: CvpA family protein [Anaerolineales bacterium]|nr:CvpA family protein [Anaerolineales bacterium]
MMSLHALFWFFVILFAFIGMFRGFKKEVMVSASVFLSLSIVALLRSYVPIIQKITEDGMTYFWVRTGALLFMILIGYQTVNLSRFQERFQSPDITNRLFGLLIGGLNGYLIFGALWYFMAQANYPFADFIIAPVAGTDWGDLSLQTQKLIFLNYITDPWIYGITFAAFLITLALFL